MRLAAVMIIESSMDTLAYAKVDLLYEVVQWLEDASGKVHEF